MPKIKKMGSSFNMEHAIPIGTHLYLNGQEGRSVKLYNTCNPVIHIQHIPPITVLLSYHAHCTYSFTYIPKC